LFVPNLAKAEPSMKNGGNAPAGDIGPQPLRPSTVSNLRDPGRRQWGDGFDTAIVDATSV
jgi:hypothetical protein